MELIVEHAWLLDLENLTSDLSFVVFIIIIIIIILVLDFFYLNLNVMKRIQGVSLGLKKRKEYNFYF